jgi:alpha-glucosidase
MKQSGSLEKGGLFYFIIFLEDLGMEDKDKKTEPVAAQTLLPVPSAIDFKEADISTRYDDVYQIITPDELVQTNWRDGAHEFVCKNGITLRIQVLAPDIVRFRYSKDSFFQPDQSYALDPVFTPSRVSVSLHERTDDFLLVSPNFTISIGKAGLKVLIRDLQGQVICEDAGGFSAKRTILKGWSEMKMEKNCHKKEAFYGLGDKACGVNLAGRKFQNWCEDSYAFGRDTDPLYRAIPFYYSLNQGTIYGIFLDNTFRSHFDFDASETGVSSFWVEGGELNYYFIHGNSLHQVARSYTRLTGTHDLPPLWALGYHQCRWSYYPDDKVREIAASFRAHQIPCDAIYLDIDYMDGYRCFTWDKSHFPNPKQLIDDLKKQGFETVLMIDPGIREDPDYPVYKEALARNAFLRTSDGEIAKAPVWPGFCAFPDFTHPDVRAWWGNLYMDMYQSLGVGGFWNDMNEPAVFHVNHKTLPDDVLHYGDGHLCSHRKAHNVYGQQMSRASWEGFRKLMPEKRPYLLTRASFSGGQRYGAVWTGDNCSDWEHLQIANIQCQRLAVSGFSFCGTDIGGFAGSCDGELFVRWLQLSVFHPLMRVHSMGHHASGDAMPAEEAELTDPVFHQTDQEPWSFGEKWTDLAKKAIELRYCLLPCLYTAMWRHSKDGTPVLRHLIFADESDPKLLDQERDFLFGEHLLVSPVVQPKTNRQGVYLPKGTWFNFWTGQPASGEVFVNVLPEQIPFFVREGAVIPVYPVRQWTGEKPVEELTLYVYYKNGSEQSSLYEDAGEGYGYKNGEFCLKTFETEGNTTGFTLHQKQEGGYSASYERIKIYLVGFPSFLKHCQADGADQPIKEIKLRDRSLYTTTVGTGFKTIQWKS